MTTPRSAGFSQSGSKRPGKFYGLNKKCHVLYQQTILITGNASSRSSVQIQERIYNYDIPLQVFSSSLTLTQIQKQTFSRRKRRTQAKTMKTFLSFMNNMFYPVISQNNRNLLLLLRTVILVTSNQTTVQQLKIVQTHSILSIRFIVQNVMLQTVITTTRLMYLLNILHKHENQFYASNYKLVIIQDVNLLTTINY